MRIWMEVTNDKYELPLKIADSGAELARMCGLHPDTLYSIMYHYKNRPRKSDTRRKQKRKFVSVEVGDE